MWEKERLFPDISSTNIDILVPSLYDCVETRNVEVFSVLSQPHAQLYLKISSSAKRLLPVNRFTRQTLPTVNRKHFFINILCIEPFCPQKITTYRCSSVVQIARSTFRLLKPASGHTHALLLPRLSWSWIVLLPSDTHRKPITSITAV
jgi:hypothetical protein